MNIIQQLIQAYGQKQYQQIIFFIQQNKALLLQEPVVTQLYANSLRALNQIDEAEKQLKMSLNVFKEHPELLNNLGNLYLAINKVELAIDVFMRARLAAPNNVDINYNLARGYIALESLKDAKVAIENTLRIQPSHIQAKVILADVLVKEKDYQSAITLLEEVVTKQPDSLLALNNIANAYRKSGDLSSAKTYFEKALTIQNSNSTILRNYAAVLALSNERQKAKETYLKCLELESENWTLQEEFSKFLWEEGDSEPFYHIHEFLDKEPHNNQFRLNFIRLLNQADLYIEANSQLDKLIELGAEPSTFAIEQARVYRELGEYEKSIASLDNVTSLTGTIPYLSEKGYSLLCVGRAAEAQICFEALIDKQPKNQGWWTMLSTCWSMTGNEQQYQWLCDYSKLVSVSRIISDLDESNRFNQTLRTVLIGQHNNQKHPIGQSLRNGTQTYEDLFDSQDAVIQALSEYILTNARQHIESITEDKSHPFCSRLNQALNYIGSWSVRLRDGGFHKSHYHPEGWLSGVYYVDVPQAVNQHGQGWLMFGRADIANQQFEGDFAVKPVEGNVVLFPSYIWHGTNAFSGNEHRLTVAFDIIPKED